MKAKKARGFKLTVSYFVTYFAILLLPILVACIFYSESIQVIRTDIENENQALLTQASNILDVRLEELNQIGTQIVNNTQVTNLRYVDSPLEYPNIQYFLQVQNVLPDYTSFNDFLFDYVLFFNRGELALSNTESYTYSDFYDLFMHPADQSKEEWLQELKDAPITFGDCTCWDMVYLRGESPVNKQLLAFSFSFLPFNNGDGQVVLYDGAPLSGMPPEQVARRAAYMAQSRNVPSIEARRMVLHGRFPYLSFPRRYRKSDYAAVRRAMEKADALELADRPMQELSGGQRQKVYLAMALAQETPAVFMDEPTTFLDVRHQMDVMRTARGLADGGKAVVLVSHDLCQALRTADRVALLADGRLCMAGTPEQVYAGGALDRVFGVRVRRVPVDGGWQYFCE